MRHFTQTFLLSRAAVKGLLSGEMLRGKEMAAYITVYSAHIAFYTINMMIVNTGDLETQNRTKKQSPLYLSIYM